MNLSRNERQNWLSDMTFSSQQNQSTSQLSACLGYQSKAAEAWRVGNSFQPEQLSDYSQGFFSFLHVALSSPLNITTKNQRHTGGSGAAKHEYKMVLEEALLSFHQSHTPLHLWSEMNEFSQPF